MVIDPLAQFTLPPPQAREGLSAGSMGVHRDDWGLLDQLRNDPKLSSVSNEIAMNRLLQVQLMRDMSSLCEEKNQELSCIFAGLAKKHGLTDPDELEAFRAQVLEELPPARLPINHVKTLSKLLETTTKLVATQKQIIEGTQLNVNVGGSEVIHQLYTQVLKPVLPPFYLEAVTAFLFNIIPTPGNTNVLELNAP